MSVAVLNLDNISKPNCLYAIYRGADYNVLRILHPNDVSLFTPCGEIRDNYLHAGGNLLASFTFDPLTFGLVTLPDNTQANRTVIVPSLPAAITSTLTPTRTRTMTDAIRLGINAYVYDIKLISPVGAVIKLIEGLVQVNPDVSDC